MTETKAIEPGQLCWVSYGNGKRVQVQSLSLRQRRKIAELIENFRELSPIQQYDNIEEALRICIPQMPDTFLDEIDEVMASQIIRSCQMQAYLSEADQKKFE